MKIVFEFRGDRPQVTFSGKPYNTSCKEKPSWKDAHVEGLIVDAGSKTKSGDVLNLEVRCRRYRARCVTLSISLTA